MKGAGKDGMMNGGMMNGGMMNGGMMAGMCPMKVAGTTVDATEVDGGVALTFTTTQSAQVEELRTRVKRMADMHNRGGMMGGGVMRADGGMKGGGMMRADGGMMTEGPMPGATASTEDVDGGARLIFKPKDTAQLQALREHVKTRAEHMKHGTCPMMAAQTNVAPSDPK